MASEEKNPPFGDYLRQRREQLGLSQQALAERVGVDRTHLSTIEGHKGNPNYSTIVSIVRGLNLSLSEFFSGEPLTRKEPPKIEVVFNGQVNEKRYKEKTLSGYRPIPIVRDFRLILNGMPEDEGIEDYFAAPHHFLLNQPLENLVCLLIESEPRAWAILNVAARTPQDCQSYAVVDRDSVFIGRATRANGVTTIVRDDPPEGAPFIYVLGRRGPKPTILGQVIFLSENRLCVPAHVK